MFTKLTSTTLLKSFSVFGLLCLPFILFAQSSYYDVAKKKALPASKNGYRLLSNDERYEGLYIKEYNDERFAIKAVTFGQILYTLNTKSNLIFSTGNLGKLQKIGVSGESFELNRNYHIDFILEQNQKKNIPMKDALVDAKVPASNFGVFGYVGNAESPTFYVPLKITVTSDGKKSSKIDEDIYITALSFFSFDKISWTYAFSEADGTCGAFSKEFVLSGNYFPSREPITMPLEAIRNVNSGSRLCIRITGRKAGTNQTLDLGKYNLLKTN